MNDQRRPSLSEHLRTDPASPFSSDGARKFYITAHILFALIWWSMVAAGCAFFLTLR